MQASAGILLDYRSQFWLDRRWHPSYRHNSVFARRWHFTRLALFWDSAIGYLRYLDLVVYIVRWIYDFFFFLGADIASGQEDVRQLTFPHLGALLVLSWDYGFSHHLGVECH